MTLILFGGVIFWSVAIFFFGILRKDDPESTDNAAWLILILLVVLVIISAIFVGWGKPDLGYLTPTATPLVTPTPLLGR
jgi:hypothetical protein